MKAFIKKNPPRFWFLVGLVLILLTTIAAIAVNYFSDNQATDKVLAKVAGENITLGEVNRAQYSRNFQGTMEEPIENYENEKNDVLNELIKYKIAQKEATESNLSLTDQDIELSIKESGTDDITQEPLKTLIRESHTRKLLIERVEESNIGWKEGKYLLFRYDKYVKYPHNGEGAPTFEGLGDQEKIQEQKTYATKKAEEIYQQLKTKSITFERAIEIVSKDNVLSAKAYEPLRVNIFGSYSKFDFENEGSVLDSEKYQGVKEIIFNTKKNEIVEPYNITSTIGSNGETSDIALLLFVNTDEGGGAFSSASKWYEEMYKKHSVTIAEENSGFSLATLIGTAKAATDYTCYKNPSGTHETGMGMRVRYYDSAGVKQLLPDGWVGLTAGDNDVNLYYSDCKTFWKSSYSYSKRTNNSNYTNVGWSFSNYSFGGSTVGLVNCASTAAATYLVDKPTFSGDRGGSFEDDPDIADPTWRTGLNNNGATIDGIAYDARTTYNLGTAGNWANGTRVLDGVIYRPNWNILPTVSLVSPANNSTIALTAGQTTANVNLVTIAHDNNNDAVRTAYYINGTISGYSPNTLSYEADDTNRTYTLSGLAPGTYTWAANASDGTGYGLYSATWSFTIVAAPSQTTGCDCDLDNPDGSSNCGQFDNHDQSMCTPPTAAATLTCSPFPATGLAPLTVRFEVTGSNLSAFQLFPNGSSLSPLSYTLNNGARTIFYTYEQGGSYNAHVTATGLGDIPCGDGAITVNDQTDSDGGEVTP